MKGEIECAIHALERASSAVGWRATASFTAAIIARRRTAISCCAIECKELNIDALCSL